ncbi:MAG: P-II family nitrogen regulator [Methanomassiliicoccales archaeon]|nr:P-II family nitrogen regulator [Methanomassiliicoccales archaeon]
MKEVMAIIRPDKLPETKAALTKMGVLGLTIMSAEGRGKQKGQEGAHKAAGGMRIYQSRVFVQKVLLTVVVKDTEADQVIRKIMSVNRTGEAGDGKIIVCLVDECIRIRTGETGVAAIS